MLESKAGLILAIKNWKALTRGLMAQSHSSWATDETILTLLQLPCNQH